MPTIPLPLLLWLSAFVFCIGIVVVLTKRDSIFVLLGIELMLNAANFNFVLFNTYDPKQQGQVFALFVMAMVVCETAVALAIIFQVYRHRKSVELDKLYPFKFRTWDYFENNLPEFGAETSLERVFKKPSSGFSGGMGIQSLREV